MPHPPGKMPSPAALSRSSGGLSTPLSRRTLFKGGAGLAGLAGLSACGAPDPNAVRYGSRSTEAIPKEAFDNVFAAFKAETGLTVDVNATDPNTYQEQINSYLQGNPDDVFAWFAGFRARFFEDVGLAAPMTHIWDEVGDNFTDAFRTACQNEAGQEIVLPFYYYPWAVFYRPSVFEANGYSIPENLSDFESLCEDMQDTGLNPIAFGAADGWPQMGTFDYLNMRINGYDFHIELMAGQQRWDSEEVKAVFEQWKDLLSYHQEGALGRTWQEAAQSLQQGESGMYVLGLFVNQQFAEGEDREDLDFFNFPEFNPSIGAGAVEAPIDGFMLRNDPENPDGADDLLRFLASAQAQQIYVDTDPQIAANVETDTSGYDQLQIKSAELVANADNISQFMDRDTRPDFAATVAIPELQRFLANPEAITDITSSMQAQAESIFG
ncbi:ABC transporter substrate-binding protein [Ornithinimicrobium sp. INDO-MA30-4]|uniref:ABC transporter substrate-binding protein n=1 Tax=Ornithinimicrobium sp. INDO-MA30-4 TaxID=2908651 RepID=UPI001F2A4A54|nr:ABC transporter substrate-binding protein [Ornithinimicrobium sp. INDO-MA30-4]UJH69919.1 ABC transporter substrate-binding protein [Ornithinimicrobium sp. INDO-MA30-4]